MKGIASYNDFYQNHFGARWSDLRTALEAPAYHVARTNAFYLINEPHFLDRITAEEKQRWGLGDSYPHISRCFYAGENFDINAFTSTLLPFYKMDPASIFAAQALGVKKGDSVLDMCAAPGGKTLVLSESMGLEGSLVANELSPKRRFRLMSVLKRYVTEELRSRIDVRGHDGVMYGLKLPAQFDRILLDAPCSGDRGLLQKPSELENWSPKRTKSLAIRQYALLASAFSALRAGGTLVYSTCALSPHENDGVIDKLFKKKKGEFEILPAAAPIGEATVHGRLILPDRDQAGPIYFCRVRKLHDGDEGTTGDGR